MALQLTAAGTSLTVLLDGMRFSERIDDPATCTFRVPDSFSYQLSPRQLVQVTDTTTSTVLYSGFILSVADEALPGNTGVRMRAVSCTDNRQRASNRLWTGDEFSGWLAGDVAAELHRATLAQEGITAAYALRHDHDAASFGQGTLSGTVVEGDTLTLASSGTDFSKTETSTADFSTGMLASVTPSGGTLSLTSSLAIKYTATAGANLESNNLYSFVKIWAGSAYTLVALDEIYVDVWIDSRSPEMKASIDLAFSDGTWMHDNNVYTDFQDRLTIPLRPSTDLQGWANDTWYQRKCIVPASRAGNVIVGVFLCFEGEKGGDYTAYFKNIKITNSGGSIVRRSIFSGADSTMKANVPASSSGYTNRKARVVTVYERAGSRITPARDLSGVGIVRSSVISWKETDAAQPSSNTSYDPQIQISTSIDGGATYQACTNHAAIPSLLVGMNTAGRALLMKQEFTVGGPSPELAPLLETCSVSVTSAAACTKTDYNDIDNNQATLGTGVLSNCTAYADGLYTTGKYRDYDDQDFSSQTLFGLSGAGNPAQGIDKDYFFLRTDGSLDCRSRFDFAGQWQNFIAEIDIQIVSAGAGNEYEFVYRTTGWSNNNNTYAYAAGITASSVTLRRAANGGTPGFTILDNISISLTVGDWYRVKTVVNGSSHQVYVNDVLYITRTDSTYTAAGYVGVRLWNGSGVRDSGHYDNFGIIGYDASLSSISSRVTPALSLGGIVGDSQVNWTAIEPASSTLVVESTLDNGATYQVCTNGKQIPFLVPGYNAAGKAIKFRFSMTNQAINIPLVLQGFSAFITGAYNALGTRVTPVLACDAAGTVGFSGLTWQATIPVGTGVLGASSLDNNSYTSLTSGSPLAGLVGQGPMMADDFDANTAANYTPTFWTGGTTPTFSVDTAHSRMNVTAGTNALLVWTSFGTAKNVNLELISDQCDAGGMAWRYIDINNLYYATYRDGSAGANPNTVAVRKRVAGVDSQIIAPTTLPGGWIRGTYHTLKVTMVDTTITCLFDGLTVAQVTDTSLTTAGWVALRQNSATTSHWSSFRAQQLGQSAVGVNAYSRLTLNSSDPAQKPVVRGLVLSVRGPDLMSGALLNTTQYRYKQTVAACLDDAASQSGMYTRIDKQNKLILKDRAYSPAPWPLYSADPLFLGTNNPPRRTQTSPEYRNRHYVYNAIDLVTITEEKIGNGVTQSWALAYPVDSLLSVTIDGDPQSFGVQSEDTGRTFYYQQGNNTLSTDSAYYPDDGVTITVIYIAQIPYEAMAENTAQQALLANRAPGTSGIVEMSEDGNGMTKAAADVQAQARIDEYAILDAATWEYSTRRSGLFPGALQSIFVPEHEFVDVDVLITGIETTLSQDSTGALFYTYDVSTTTGPNLGIWQRLFARGK